MPSAELLREAERQMTVCNACRYCEGYCAVFPAMELRTSFEKKDVIYLANLCFDCRDCYYACPFQPPHAYAINVPKVFAELRTATYREYSPPTLIGRVFRRNGLAMTVAALLAVVTVASSVLVLAGPTTLFGVHLGEGAFYRVVPFGAMVLPALAMAAYAVGAFALGAVRFWRDTGGPAADLFDGRAFARATSDAIGLTYLKGGGASCTYPNEHPSAARRWLHHLVFWGFLVDLASTTVAAIYHDILGWLAPYALLSVPVVLGTAGGLMIVIGCGGLLVLKGRADRRLADPAMLAMDVAFIAVLGLTALSGLLLLAWRESALMGSLLVVHLGLVAAFFLTLPYGKLAHAVFRYAALVRNAMEQRQT